MQAFSSVGLGSAVPEILGFELDNDMCRESWMMSIASISGAEPVRAPVRIAHSFPHLTTFLSKYRYFVKAASRTTRNSPRCRIIDECFAHVSSIISDDPTMSEAYHAPVRSRASIAGLDSQTNIRDKFPCQSLHVRPYLSPPTSSSLTILRFGTLALRSPPAQ